MNSYNGKIVFFSALIAGCSGLLFGFDTGIIADTQWQLSSQFHFNHFQWSLIVSSMIAGAFLGALSSSHAVEKFGRKQALTLTAALFIIGTILVATTHGFSCLFWGRFILGISIGISAYCAPLLISEIAEEHQRGRYVLINNIGITGGEALAFFLGYMLQDYAHDSWRLMFILGILPALFLLIGIQFIPQSPRWLLKKGHTQAALNVLIKLRNNDLSKAQQELNTICNNLHSYQEPPSLFQKPFLKIVMMGATLGLLQQAAGINTVMYYGPYIFNSVGFTPTQSLLATFVIGIFNTLFTVFAMLTVDTIGRKKLLFRGSFVCGLALLLLAQANHFSAYGHWIAFFSIFIYIMAFAVSLGSMFWLLIAEIYPLQIRAKAMSFTSSIQWLANFLVSFAFLPLTDTLGSNTTMMLLAFFCFTTVLFTYLFVPETKGVSLEKIEQNLFSGMKLKALGAPQ